MSQGYTLPIVGAAGWLLMAGLDLHRTTPAALAPLNADQRARFGRYLMRRQEMIMAWVCAGMALLPAFTFLYLGYAAWWVWFVLAAASVTRIGARVQARARFHAFMASQHKEAPAAPAFDRLWAPRLLFGVTLCVGALALMGGTLIDGLRRGNPVELGLAAVSVSAILALLFFVVGSARVSAARAKLARTRPWPPAVDAVRLWAPPPLASISAL